MMRYCFIPFYILFFFSLSIQAQTVVVKSGPDKINRPVAVGAERTSAYFPYLKGKTLGLVVNQTSTIGGTHLVDSLLAAGMKIKAIFAPEHGFRGNADAGEKLKNSIDPETGIPIVSLYGNHHKPSAADLKGLDLVIFDIQDVGTRFYTYISTLNYVMEACAENGVELMVLDRPNPNGFYVDGPVLEPEYSSFVGMNPVPIVHGMTVGEYAQMINGEGWLANGVKCSLKIVEMTSWNHNTLYELPIKPSPNLPNNQSIYLYPSLCFFEGTAISVGRGTYFPFQVMGHPSLKKQPFSFMPESIVGMSKHPKLENQTCFGVDLRKYDISKTVASRQINLKWLMGFYNDYPNKSEFFNAFFIKLAGTDELQKQLEQGKSEAFIRASWEPALSEYKKMRKQYLLYPDFD